MLIKKGDISLNKYIYKNGMRFLNPEFENAKKDGYNYHGDISNKMGLNQPRLLKLHVKDRHSAGVFVPFRIKMTKINSVKLNNQILQPKIDFVVKNNEEIAFTFNLISSDKIEINGVV